MKEREENAVKHNWKRILSLLLVLVMMLAMTACGASGNNNQQPTPPAENTTNENQENNEENTEPEPEPEPEPAPVEKNGDIVILFTSDIHCGVDQGFGYAGLQAVRDYLIAQGNDVILVDNGDLRKGGPKGQGSHRKDLRGK